MSYLSVIRLVFAIAFALALLSAPTHARSAAHLSIATHARAHTGSHSHHTHPLASTPHVRAFLATHTGRNGSARHVGAAIVGTWLASASHWHPVK